jgi:hypothetical protein
MLSAPVMSLTAFGLISDGVARGDFCRAISSDFFAIAFLSLLGAIGVTPSFLMPWGISKPGREGWELS